MLSEIWEERAIMRWSLVMFSVFMLQYFLLWEPSLQPQAPRVRLPPPPLPRPAPPPPALSLAVMAAARRAETGEVTSVGYGQFDKECQLQLRRILVCLTRWRRGPASIFNRLAQAESHNHADWAIWAEIIQWLGRGQWWGTHHLSTDQTRLCHVVQTRPRVRPGDVKIWGRQKTKEMNFTLNAF